MLTMSKCKRQCEQTDMNGQQVLCFKMLGSFTYGEKGSGDKVYGGGVKKTGKKALSLLQYLIVNHGRCVSAEELIEKFWAEGSSQGPGNALRNMLFKDRQILKEMFPAQEELLQTVTGGYVWSDSVRLELDTEQFEKLCMESGTRSGGGGPELLVEAVGMYRGDFLSGNDSEWAAMLRRYYRTLYLDACKELLPVLHKSERWMELIGICEQAYRVDFAIEEFTAYQMRALIARGQPERALTVYGTYRVRLEQEYGMFPSEELEKVRALALGMKKRELNEAEIFRLVQEEKTEQKAFICTFEIFRNIVALEKRHLGRTGSGSALAIMSLGKGDASMTDVRRLERILLEGLRVGDPIARLEAGAYILLLTGADEEKARMVMDRLDMAFHKTYRHSKARLTYRVTAL